MIDTIGTAPEGQLVPVADISPDVTLNRPGPWSGEDELDETSADWGPGGPADVRRRDQRGMVSAEWAVGIIAAIAIAGVLLTIVTSGPVKAALLKVILMIIGMFTQNAHFLKL